MREYLLLGPGSPINLSIATCLNSEKNIKLTWLVVEDSKFPHSTDIGALSKVNFILVKRDQGLLKSLEELNPKNGFKGVVYAEGIGGVRPVKLVNDGFIQDMFQANVFRFFELVRALIKSKNIADGSSILTLSSVSSIKGLKSKAVYSASKAALDGAVRGIAAELAPKGIRVNSILKGWVDADMSLDFIKNNLTLAQNDDLALQPLGPIKPNELANLIKFLLSNQVKSITGTSIIVDGGYTL